GKGYCHKDLDFKQLLQQVDGLRFTPPLPDRSGRVKRIYLYQCPHCGQEYRRKRKIDLKKYACGRCHSRLQFLEMRQE
ncbi:MAG: SprT family protein, partial [Streptococcus parasanguinis]|nr:SprT family protein [Streptococcus parasanguinis]